MIDGLLVISFKLCLEKGIDRYKKIMYIGSRKIRDKFYIG